MSTECLQARDEFSGYLDGAISGREMQAVAAHLEACVGCSAEFAGWRGMQEMLGAVAQVKAPADLGLQLRVAISHESSRRQGHWWDGAGVRWDNFVRPALAGAAGAFALVGCVVTLVGMMAAPQAVLAHDEPLGAMTRAHFLYSEARLQPVMTGADGTIVIEAAVNAEGRVYDYTILSGPQDNAVLEQVRDQLMVQVYEPARVFGEPVKGRVLLTFAGVSVRG